MTCSDLSFRVVLAVALVGIPYLAGAPAALIQIGVITLIIDWVVWAHDIHQRKSAEIISRPNLPARR